MSYGLALAPSWNLLGNSLNQSLSLATLFNDPGTVVSVWKCDAGTSVRQFYTPQMNAAAMQTFAASKGYAVLSEIKPGEGNWANA